MELEKTTVNTREGQQFLDRCFNNWSNAFSFIKGEGLFPELVKKYEMLFKLAEGNPNIHAHTILCLKIIFG